MRAQYHHRQEAALAWRIKQARLPEAWTLESFPFKRQPGVNPKQIRTLEALSETIIPADEHSPGGKAARVWEYIDEIVADADKGAKDLWTQGLAFLNGVAQQEHGKNFEDCTADLYAALVERISQNEDAPTRPEDRFFVTAKRATIDGYYASAIGIHQDLLYQGK